MEARLIFRIRFSLANPDRRLISVYMDLFELPVEAHESYPERFKFSWIAFDLDRPELRVLMDCHPPKGPHIHLDLEEVELPYEWVGLHAARGHFRSLVLARFGVTFGGNV